MEFEMIAKTFQGLEEVLAEELTNLGANNISIGRRMVSFTGDKELMYRANYSLRTAIRILKPIKHFQANNPDEMYEQVKAIEWDNYLNIKSTFAVDAVVYSEEFRHSMFASYRVKDAISDYFREKTGNRPSVSVSNPDILLNIHIAENNCTLSLDSSGESLHRRGYRVETGEAPLSEVLAAGMILMTGWRGECDLIDPMCGSGTILIEAALIARNIAPGLFRKGYAFEKWADFDSDLFEKICSDDSNEREFTHKIYGYDISPKVCAIARRNVTSASLGKDIILDIRPFEEFTQPKEKAIIITNPPYGERITTDDLLGLYESIGERLKKQFKGNTAWILSYRDECFAKIGLKPSKKIELNNGALECQFRQYEMFDGSYKDFLEGGGKLDKAEDDSSFPKKKRFDREKKPFRKERSSYGRSERLGRKDSRDFKNDGKPSFRKEKPKDRFGKEKRRGDERPRRTESYPERKRRERDEKNMKRE